MAKTETSLEKTEMLQSLASRVASALDSGQELTALSRRIFQELTLSHSQIETELLAELTAQYPNLKELLEDPEAQKVITEYINKELQKEQVVKAIIDKIVEQASLIKQNQQLIASLQQELATLKEQYWQKYGKVAGRLRTDWGEFQGEIQEIEATLKQQMAKTKALEENITIGITKLALHYNCYKWTIPSSARGTMDIEVLGKTYYSVATNLEELQNSLQFKAIVETTATAASARQIAAVQHDVATRAIAETSAAEDEVAAQTVASSYIFEPNDLTAIRQKIKEVALAKERQQVLVELRESGQIADSILEDSKLQKLIAECAEISYEIKVKRGLLGVESSEELSTDLEEFEQKYKNLKDKIQAGAAFIKEFTQSFGHELITEDEWQAALTIMVDAKVKLGAKDAANQEDIIRAEQAKLAELIMQRMIYQIFEPTFLAADPTANQEIVPLLRELPTILSSSTVTKEQQSKLASFKAYIQNQLQQVYGYQAFYYLEQNGSTNSIFRRSPNKLKAADWGSLTTGIAARWLTYNAENLSYDSSFNKISQQLESFSQQLTSSSLIAIDPEQFNQAVTMLKAEINQQERQRQQEIQAIYQDHNAKLQKLLEQFRYQGFSALAIEREETYQLTSLRLTEPAELYRRITQLVAESQQAIKQVEENYALNKRCAENLVLFRLQAGKVGSAEEYIQAFKAQVGVNESLEQYFKISIETSKKEISEIEEEIQKLREEIPLLHRQLIGLGKQPNIEGRDDKIKALKAKILEHIKQVDVLKEKLVNARRSCRTYQQLFAQLHAERQLKQRQLMNLVPPRYEGFLVDFAGFLHSKQNLSEFAKDIASLAQGNQDSLEELFGYAAEVIKVLPTLDMPDVSSNGELNFSEHNLNDIIKSYIILAEAKKAAASALARDPNNVYFKILAEDLNNSFKILANKILVHPLQEAVMGFELLTEERQLYYIQKIGKFPVSGTARQLKLQELNKQIAQEVKQKQFEIVREQIDILLEQWGAIGTKIKTQEKLYNGLINHAIVLSELVMMQDRLKEYLESNDFVGNEVLREIKQKELEQIAAEITKMRQLFNDDFHKIVKVLTVAQDQQSLPEIFRQNTQYWLSRMAYIGAGAVVGCGITKICGNLCSILGSITGYEMFNSASASLPYAGVAAGLVVGNEASKHATEYSDANIAGQLSLNEFTKIKEYDNNFIALAHSSNKSINSVVNHVANKVASGYSTTKVKIKNLISGFINKHKKAFLGILAAAGIGIGIAVSVATMGIATPIVAAVGLSTVAAFATSATVGLIGAVSTVGTGLWVRHKIMLSRAIKLSKNLKEKIKEIKREDLLLSTIQALPPEAELNKIINILQEHLQQQRKLIIKRTNACDPSNMDSDTCAKILTREFDCLQDMQKISQELKELINTINHANAEGSRVLAQQKQQELLLLIDNYLVDNYQQYHGLYMIDYAKQKHSAAIVELEQQMEARREILVAEQVTQTRQQYITRQFAVDSKEQPISKDEQQQQNTIEQMSSLRAMIKSQINSFR